MIQKKRLVIDISSCVTSAAHPQLSGIGRTTLELVRALEKQQDLPFELLLFSQVLKRERLKRFHFQSKEFYLPFPSCRWLDELKNKIPVIETLTRSDVYHIPQNHAPFFRGNKTVLTIHDAMIFEIREDHLYSQKERFSLKRDAERCGAIITCSNYSRERLLRHLDVPEDKITVAPWGYDRDVFFPQASEIVSAQLRQRFQILSPYLFSVSCDVGRKRTPELVRQFLHCCSFENYPFDLVLVWRKPPVEILKLIESSKYAKKIKILSGVSDLELSLLYNGATCLIFPSTYEGFGLPLLESMACGTPVITTKKTSLPEIAGEAGIYLDSLEESAIGDKLLALAENKFDLKTIAEIGIKRAKSFSWKKCAATTIDVYEKLLD